MRKSIVGSILGLMLLFVRCNSSIDADLFPENGSVPINIAVKEDRISTRAPVSTINSSNITSVGVYGVSESSTSGVFPWTTSPPLLNLVPAGITGGKINFSPSVYYPDGGKRLMFYAYYPRTTATSGNSYVTAPGNGTAPIFNFTVADQQDIMYAASTPFGSNTPGTPTLSFSHKLTQIILDTSVLGGLKSIKLTAVKNKGALNLGTGVVTYTSATVDIPLSMQSGLLSYLTVPVMVPADVDKYRVDVTLLVLTLTYYIRPTSGNFLPGTIYTIKLPIL